jgi:hypothetical protein
MKSQSLHQRNAKIAKRIAELAEKLKPQGPATHVQLDYSTFPLNEQYILLKNQEIIDEVLRTNSVKVLRENIEIMFKAQEILYKRTLEVFKSVIPAVLWFDVIEKHLFYFFLSDFLEEFFHKVLPNIKNWSEEERESHRKMFEEIEKNQQHDQPSDCNRYQDATGTAF